MSTFDSGATFDSGTTFDDVTATVTAFTPSVGPTTGNTLVTVVGDNLDAFSEVSLGVGGQWVDAFDVTVTPTTITFRTPPAFAAGAGFVPGPATIRLSLVDGTTVSAGSFVYVAAPTPAPGDGEGECRRRAWLVLPATGQIVELEDPAGSWVCPDLLIDWPDIRAVVNNRPDQHGVDDRTSLFGARPVSARIVAGTGGADTIDDVVRKFGPFMVPGQRPELHWVLNTPADGYTERMLTVRATNFSSPITGPWTRDIALGWVAPDPIIYNAVLEETVARPAWGTTAGRVYNLTFPRVYPPGGGPAVPGTLTPVGDVIVWPVVRVWGPIIGPTVTISNVQASTSVVFTGGYTLAAGQWVDIDSKNRSIVQYDGAHVEGDVAWAGSGWPFALPGMVNTLTLTGAGTSATTQAVATWRDGFLEA